MKPKRDKPISLAPFLSWGICSNGQKVENLSATSQPGSKGPAKHLPVSQNGQTKIGIQDLQGSLELRDMGWVKSEWNLCGFLLKAFTKLFSCEARG